VSRLSRVSVSAGPKVKPLAKVDFYLMSLLERGETEARVREAKG